MIITMHARDSVGRGKLTPVTPLSSRRLAPAMLAAGALLALQTPADGLAQEAAVPDTASYAVEIVIFRHLDQRNATPPVAVPAKARDDFQGLADDLEPPAPAPNLPVLPGTQMRLAGIAARLQQIGRYKLLYHGGWVQPIRRQQDAIAAPLPAEAQSQGLRGNVTVYRERYPHALLDVSFRTGDAPVDSPARIRQGRRLRGEAPQYFDHPEFGVILSARPVAGNAEEDPEQGDVEEDLPTEP